MTVATEVVDGFAGLATLLASVGPQFEDIDYEPPLTEFLGTLEETHATYFNDEKSPAGTAWPQLAPSTIVRKGHDGILLETGALRSSLTAPGQGIRQVGSAGLLFGSDVPYSAFHQFGTGLIPPREHAGINNETTQLLIEAIADHCVESMKHQENS